MSMLTQLGNKTMDHYIYINIAKNIINTGNIPKQELTAKLVTVPKKQVGKYECIRTVGFKY